jgi:hypothetical protein
VLGEVRQLEDRLGLSPMSMLRMRWAIVAEDDSEPAAPPARHLRVAAVDHPESDHNGQ